MNNYSMEPCAYNVLNIHTYRKTKLKYINDSKVVASITVPQEGLSIEET